MKINVKEEKIVVSTDIHIHLETKEDVQVFKDLLTYARYAITNYSSVHSGMWSYDNLNKLIDELEVKT